jgi:threonine/homoserine/homoserine lactone efflux protein
MDISLTIVRAIVYLVILCVQCFRLRRKNKNLKNRLPAKKAQDLPRAVVYYLGILTGALGPRALFFFGAPNPNFRRPILAAQ